MPNPGVEHRSYARPPEPEGSSTILTTQRVTTTTAFASSSVETRGGTVDSQQCDAAAAAAVAAAAVAAFHQTQTHQAHQAHSKGHDQHQRASKKVSMDDSTPFRSALRGLLHKQQAELTKFLEDRGLLARSEQEGDGPQRPKELTILDGPATRLAAKNMMSSSCSGDSPISPEGKSMWPRPSAQALPCTSSTVATSTAPEKAPATSSFDACDDMAIEKTSPCGDRQTGRFFQPKEVTPRLSPTWKSRADAAAAATAAAAAVVADLNPESPPEPTVVFIESEGSQSVDQATTTRVSTNTLQSSRSAILDVKSRAPRALEKVCKKAKKKHPLMKDPISSRTMSLLASKQNHLERFLKSRVYEALVMLVVILNAAFIGYQVQWASHSQQDYAVTGDISVLDIPDWAVVGEHIFLVVFTFELGIRLFGEGKDFFLTAELNWNLLDLFIVIAMISEFVIELATSGAGSVVLAQMSSLRILRVMRIMRILRIIRVLKFFSELRMMLSCILNSFRSLVWAMLVLLLLFYIFGISLTQGAVDFLSEDPPRWTSRQHQVLRKHFSRLDFSVLSLFEAMAGGISWGELVDAITPIPWIYTGIFCVFISFAIFAVLNIVTGVFVQSALERAQLDKETLIQDSMQHKEGYLLKMQQIFQEIDVNGSGTISLDEFQEAMEDERMGAYFDALGINVEDIDTLFTLLDRDGAGSVDIEEFLAGCLKLKGEAKGLDLAIVQFEAKWLMHHIGQLTHTLSMCGVLQDGFTTTGLVMNPDSPTQRSSGAGVLSASVGKFAQGSGTPKSIIKGRDTF